METQPETKTLNEEKHSFSWTGFVVWTLVVLILYALSVGPVLMMIQKGLISWNVPIFYKIYTPLFWAAEHTPLGKPLGMYIRLWAPWFYK